MGNAHFVGNRNTSIVLGVISEFAMKHVCRLKTNVILSAGRTSRSEVPPESKDPMYVCAGMDLERHFDHGQCE